MTLSLTLTHFENFTPPVQSSYLKSKRKRIYRDFKCYLTV